MALLVACLLPALVVAATPVANDDPGPACGNTAFGGSYPIPEDFYAPYLVDALYPGDEGKWFPIFGSCGLLSNDTDQDGDPLTYEILDGPTHGQVRKLDEAFTAYRPDADFNTLPGDMPGGDWVSDSFTYRACDATTCSSPATMRIWVVPINDPPSFTAGPDLVQVDQDSGPYDAPWASDVAAGPANESWQHVSFEVTDIDLTGVPDLFSVPPTIDATGRLRFTPGPGQVGLAQVTVRARDDGILDPWESIDTFHTPIDASPETQFEIAVMPIPADTAAPIVAPPAERFLGQTVGSTTTKVRLNWSATDAGSGVASYKLQVSTDGGSYKTVKLAKSTSTSVDRTLTNGHRYRFRVLATDKEGNASHYSYGPTLTPKRYSQEASAVVYAGSWKKATTAKALGGSTRYASSPSRSATYIFTAYDVGWIATRSTSSGKAQILIDGVLVKTVDLDTSSSAYRKLVFQRHFPTLGAHTLQIRPVGDGRVDVDGFVVLR